MFIPLLLGCLTIFISMGVQLIAVVFMLRYLTGIVSNNKREFFSIGFNTYVMSMVLLLLFTGHMLQIAIWSVLFMFLGEFNDFMTAFYHSTVNFASMGYGDIVMSEEWRLLGALEASNGVLMFGLSAGTILAVMSQLFTARSSTGVKFAEKNRK